MPICQNCEQKFPTRIVIDGRERNLCSRKYCLKCSPFAQHNTSRIHLPAIERTRKRVEYICVSCNKHRNEVKNSAICGTCRKTKYRKKRQQRVRAFLGGKCQKCDYDLCPEALDCHHVNPKDKLFAISGAWGRNWEEVKAEASKCVLLCNRCHREFEHGLIAKEEITRMWRNWQSRVA